jgi:DNA polymerase-1
VKLNPEHRTYLEANAVDIDVAEEIGAYSVSSVDDLPEEFSSWGPRAVPGIVFPYPSASNGLVVPQLRPDVPIERPGEKPLKYVFPAGTTGVLCVHPRMRARVADPAIPLVIVEGTKQYLAGVGVLTSVPVATVGTFGCYGWSSDHRPIPDLAGVPWEGRTVYLLFDGDLSTNEDVWTASTRLAEELDLRGATEIKWVNLPGTEGLDDFLVRMPDRHKAMLRLLDKAQPKPPKKPRARRHDYIGPDGRLLLDKLAVSLADEIPMALAEDGSIAVYRAGVYITDPRAIVGPIRSRLGDDFRQFIKSAVEELIVDELINRDRILPAKMDEPLLNCANGLVDLRTGELRPHDPEILSFWQVPVPYDPAAECPRYEKWLDEQAGDQADDLEEVLGAALDPSRTPQKAGIVYGPSRSGKSTILRIAKEIIGAHNTSGVTLHQLDGRDKHASSKLYRKALNLSPDLSVSHVADLAIFKAMTGADLIEADRKWGATFNFTNTALFFFSANEPPSVSETSRAYLERIKPFKFERSFAGHEDQAVEDRMIREAPGILRRWVEAYGRYLARGTWLPSDPEIMEEFARISDRVRLWLHDETKAVESPLGTAGNDLYQAFKRWARDNEGHGLGKKKFFDRLRSAGVEEYQVHRTDAVHFRVVLKDRIGGIGGISGHPFSSTNNVSDEGTSHRREKMPFGSTDSTDSTSSHVHARVVDLETGPVEDLWRTGRSFLRLVGTEDGIGQDPRQLIDHVDAGGSLAAHNGLGFDYLVLGRFGLDVLRHGDAGRLLDTKVLAMLADPPPAEMKSGQVIKRYGLDELAGRLGLPGKEMDLEFLAKEFGGFDRIPLDEPRYREYLEADVRATRALLDALPMDDYGRREHRLLSRLAASVSLVGFRVDESLLRSRMAEGQEVTEAGLEVLRGFGLPTTMANGKPAKAPHATRGGKEAIDRAVLDLTGVQLPRTRTGSPSTGKTTMARLFEWARANDEPEAALVAETVLALNGVRSVYGTVDAYVARGRVHPEVDARQAAGRFSVTKPGLTVFGKRDGRHVEREIFLPEPGHVLLAVDMSQVDMRAIAGLCQDPGYMRLFAPGIDAHAEISRMVWGTPDRREEAKAIGHGWNYGRGTRAIAEAARIPLDAAEEFDRAMTENFPVLVEWRSEVRERAGAGELLDNGWGRRMRPDPDRAWTQAPALMGQGAARDLMAEAILRLPLEIVPMLRAVVHDELVFTIPATDVDEIRAEVLEAMTFEWRGVPILAKAEKAGGSWRSCYEE